MLTILNEALIVSAMLLMGLFGSTAIPQIEKEEEYKAEIDRWHHQRIESVKKEHGWLSLIDLIWLGEGENKIPLFGSITLKKGTLFVALKNNIQATFQGKIFSSGLLQPEKDKIVFGPKAFVVIVRDGKYAVRIWDSESTARKNFAGVERYPVSKTWRVEARWETFANPKTIEIPTVVPGVFGKGIVPGVAIFVIDGKELRLEPTTDSAQTEFSFVFSDRTNGKETYGAGRFLDVAPPINGKIILDFNKAINPPCAFTNFATCPIPLKENRMLVRIEAGEKKYVHQ